MEIVKNTRRVPSKSIFESLAVNFYVQSNRYQIRRSWPASSKFQINIVYSTKKKETQKRRRRRKREEMRWDEMTYILNLTGALEKDNAGAFIWIFRQNQQLSTQTLFLISAHKCAYFTVDSSLPTSLLILFYLLVSVCACVCVYFGFLLRFDKITAF